MTPGEAIRDLVLSDLLATKEAEPGVTAREFVVNAVVGGLLVSMAIYLAVLMLLKGMQSVVGVLKPIAALLPDWVPGENFLSLVVVLIICFAVGAAVRTRAGRSGSRADGDVLLR